MATLKYFDGKEWIEIGGGGGGGSSHTHPNLSLLNSITQAMVTAWQTASSWVTTNGSAVLSHIADSLLHLPSGGSVGQVLKKTASGTEWANESGGGGGGAGLQYLGVWSVKTNTTVDITVPSGATGLLFMGTTSSTTYSLLIPVNEIGASYATYGISASNTNISIRLKKAGNIVNMTRSSTTAYNITVYAI